MKSILLAHARKYPLMEPTDAVKLIYQNEFGGGHLISDADACLNFLHREYRATPQNPVAPLTEDIGNGIVRVNLASLDAHNLSLEELGQSFIRSASLHKGSMDSFLNKLSILTELTQAGHMSFSISKEKSNFKGEALKQPESSVRQSVKASSTVRVFFIRVPPFC